MRARHQQCTGFMDCAPGSINDMALDLVGDLPDFDAEDWVRWTFKGGGGIGGIIKSVVVGAALGAVTGGLGAWMFGSEAFSVFGMEFAKDSILGGMLKGSITGAAGGLLMGGYTAFAAQKQSETQQANYEARDNKLTVRNSTGPRKKIYGSVLAGGLMVYATSTGSTHEYFHSVNVIATHQVQAIREAFFNNLTETNSRFNGFYRLNKHLGSQTQAADSDLVSEAGGEWTAAHRLRESAYIYPRIKYDTNAWVSGLPATSVMVDGGILYDPRSPHAALSSSAIGAPGVFTTATAHGFQPGDIVFLRNHVGATYAAPNGLHKPVSKWYTVNTVPSSTTFTLLNDSGEPMPLLTGGVAGDIAKCGWSNNWALAVLDFVTSRDGINAKTSEVDWAYWEDAANVSDESVDLGTDQTFTASATSNAITLAGGVGWQSGKQVFVSSTGTLPAPLATGTAYYWIRSDETTGQLATSYDNAIAGTAIDVTDAGTGTHTVTLSTQVTLSASADTVTLPNLSTYIETGDCITLTGALAGTDYYWINTGYLTGKLATSRANAMAGVTVDIASDETVRITRKNQARYTLNGIIDLSKKPIDILNEMLTAGGGVMVYTQGKYRLFAAAPASSVKTINQDDLRGSIKILPHTSRMTLVNAVRGTYKEPAKYWEMTDFPPLTNATYEDEDGGQRLYKDIALPHTIDPQRAQRIASIVLGRARRGMVVNFPGTVKLLGISAWDCITLNLDVGAASVLAEKKFRVVSWQLAENGQGIDLTLNEEDDAIYTWNASSGAVVPQNDLSSLPDPWNVPAPTSLTLSSGTDDLLVQNDGSVVARIRAAWTDPADATIIRIEVQGKPSESEAWEQFTPALVGQQAAYLSPVTDGESWDVRIRGVNSFGATSAWVTYSDHFVIGKTAPPSDPANLYVTGGNVVWQQPTRDKDLAGWRVRHLSGRSRNWSQGADYPADGSVITVPNISATAFGSGTQTVMVRAVDTSGNLSTGILYLTLGLGEESPDNLILTHDEAADGFQGTITGGSVVDGELVADSSGDLYLPDANALYLPVIGNAYLPGSWQQLTYEFSYQPAYADAPARLLLDSTVAADGWQTLYRRRGVGLYLQYDDDAYLADDSSPYLGGAQPFTTWPGELPYNARETLDFRVVAEAGSRRGTVSALALKIDVPDITESFQDLSIAPGGTRVPLTKEYRVIDFIGEIVIQDNGSGAVDVQYVDKNPTLGPLLKAVDASGNSVAAVIDIRNLKGH